MIQQPISPSAASPCIGEVHRSPGSTTAGARSGGPSGESPVSVREPICSQLPSPVAATPCEHQDIRLNASTPPVKAQCPSPPSKTTTEEGDGPSEKPEDLPIESDSSIQSNDERPLSPVRLVEQKGDGRRSPSEATEAATSPVGGPSAIRLSGEDRGADRSEDHRCRQPVRDSDPCRSPSEAK